MVNLKQKRCKEMGRRTSWYLIETHIRAYVCASGQATGGGQLPPRTMHTSVALTCAGGAPMAIGLRVLWLFLNDFFLILY